jgi:hypothetical protein
MPQLLVSDATITRIEQAVTNARNETAQEINGRILAEGNATNLNSPLLISEVSRVRLQDDNELLNQSAATLSNHRNQVMTENQTLLVSLEQAKSDLKLTQRNSSAENAVQFKKLEAIRISDIAASANSTRKFGSYKQLTCGLKSKKTYIY